MRAQLESRVPLTDGRTHRPTGTALFKNWHQRPLYTKVKRPILLPFAAGAK